MTIEKKKILTVDDSASTIKILQTILERKGFSVITAYDGKTGLKKARKISPDLIIYDINLPEMNGFEACEILKSDQLTKDIPVVMLSARDMGYDFETAMKKNADWYIVKPINPNHLLRVINKLLN
ncbi:MAG: response regulator [Elusimicrobiota bacterium]